MTRQMAKVWRTEGLRGLYRGWWPPLWGSGLYRSIQFAVFEGLYTKWGVKPDGTKAGVNETWWTTEIPGTGGMQHRVLIAAILASSSRATVECPVEYAKVNRQILQSYRFRDMFTGFGYQLVRSNGVMVTYFCVMDYLRRRHTSIFDTPWGAGIASACCATFGFWLVWPAEVLKNQVQGKTSLFIEKDGQKVELKNPSARERVTYLLKEHGVRGLYRGIWPGTVRSMLSNGVAMIVMRWANKKVTEWGLR